MNDRQFADSGAPSRAQKPIVQSTVVQPAPAAPAASFDQWGAVVYVLGGVIALVTLASGIMSIIDRIIVWRKQGETEDAGELGKVEARVKELETTCKDFMPRREIEKGFAHERENRLTGEQAAVSRFERTEDRLGANERAVTRVETEMQGQSASMSRIERVIERMDEKLDRAIAGGKP